MRKIDKQLALGLLVLVLAAGCFSDDDRECEITCSDGFHTTQDGSCAAVNLTSLAQQHGGQCRAEEHL